MASEDVVMADAPAAAAGDESKEDKMEEEEVELVLPMVDEKLC